MEKRVYRPYSEDVLSKLHGIQLELLNAVQEVCQRHDLPVFLIYGTAIGAVRHGGFIPWDDDIDVGMLRKDYDQFIEFFKLEMSDKYEILTPEIDSRYACTVCHVQKKGTTFITEVSKDLKSHMGIFIDIFPFDAVPDGKLAQKSIQLKTAFWGKLLFLAGTPNPVIPLSGIKYYIASFLCKAIHYFLAILHISPKFIYRRFIKNSTKYNEENLEYVTSYEYFGCLHDKIKIASLFPLRKTKFENITCYLPKNNNEFLTSIYGDFMKLPPESKRVNHAPLHIDFGE